MDSIRASIINPNPSAAIIDGNPLLINFMQGTIENNLNLLAKDNLLPLLRVGLVGIEKESLRTDLAGLIATTDHPDALGSALTHPYITTDYSEALLEFVTPPCHSAEQAISFLASIHQFVYANIKNECLWPASMPCKLQGEQSIRIAEYGHSNLGLMKHVYRRGLGHRYGKVMQVIAGIHVNLSMPKDFWPPWQDSLQDRSQPQAFINQQYFGLIRNIQRVGWLIPYLFGASPAVDKSFSHQSAKDLQQWDENTLYVPDATSLRLGDIGYTNHRENEIGIKACYDSLSEYVKCLARATETPYAPYQEIGVKVANEYRQLNANILQIENEYYSTVRPKQSTKNNEKPAHALLARGVEYVELRSLDLNPFSRLGISIEQLRFIEVFFIYCLLNDQALIDRHEREEIDFNEYEVCHHGRKAGLCLRYQGRSMPLKQWAQMVFQDMGLIAGSMDKNNGNCLYTQAVNKYRQCVEAVEQTLSAKILAGMRENKLSYYDYMAGLGKHYCRFYADHHHDGRDVEIIADKVAPSRARQNALEADNQQDFTAFLNDYFSTTYTPDD